MWQYLLEKMSQHIRSKVDRYTYKELLCLSEEKGRVLLSKASEGTVCGILCNDAINSVIALLSCWYAKFVPVPLSDHYGGKHNQQIMDVLTPTLVLTDREIHLLKYPHADSAGKDAAVILCTSGTTGLPKGIVHTRESIISNIEGILDYFPINSSDHILIARPLCHSAVFTGELLAALICGTNITFYQNKYHPGGVLQRITAGDITVMGSTPTMLFHMACLHTSDKSIPLHKLVISGEPMSSKTAQKIKKTFANTDIYSVYGLTEAGPRVSYLKPDQFHALDGSVGLPLKNVSIKITDENHTELPPEHKGVVWVKSPSLMKEYYRDEALTSRVLHQGWLNTGDVGYQDKNGYLYLCGRVDDMIIKAGMNIYPKEITSLVDSIPAIQKSFIYGFETAIGQEIGMEVLLEKDYRHLKKKDIMELLSEVLADYQMPARLRIVDQFNTTLSGKVRRYEVSE